MRDFNVEENKKGGKENEPLVCGKAKTLLVFNA